MDPPAVRKDALGLCIQLGKWENVDKLVESAKRLERFLLTGE